MRFMPDPTPGQKAILDGIEPLHGANILEKLAGGPASDSWLLKAGNEQFVARLDKPLARLLGLDRRAELEVLHTVSVAGIGPQIIWSDPDKGVLVTSWIPGNAWSIMDVHDPVKLGTLAATLRRLHSLPPRGPVFAPGEIALAYAREAGTHGAARIAEQAAKLAEKLSSETGRPALCHNDLVHSNIIGGETVRLIDWEYSAVGDPYFDLAIVVQHHQLKADRVEILLNAYFGTPGKEHFSRLEAFCRLYDQLAALWYLSVIRQPGYDALYDEELNRVIARL
jgi:aminoglycoside phosphotransferase (APT) family kinase protein